MGNRLGKALILGSLFAALPAGGQPPGSKPSAVAAAPTQAQKVAGAAAFSTVANVLRHPRCMNCHPIGNAPLQGDLSQPHTMMVTRDSPKVGLDCTTCHRPTGVVGEHLPPVVSVWQLPPANQVFEGRTDRQLCDQLNDPNTTGGRDHAALLEHVSHDALVLYGWNPGPGRTTPATSHSDFVAAFTTWVAGGGACPP